MRIDALDRRLSLWRRAAGIASLYSLVMAAGLCADRHRPDTIFL
jgi:hypothetical protein